MKKRILKAFLAVIGFLVSILVLVGYLSSSTLPAEERTQTVFYQSMSQPQDSLLNVVTYNLGYLSGMTNNRSIVRERAFFDENLRNAKALFAKREVDIVGFQEIDFASSRSFHRNQMDSLAQAGGFVAGYKSVNWDKRYVPFPYWPPSNHFGKMLSGQAIVANTPLAKGQTITLAPYKSAPAYYRAFYLDRLLQLAEVEFLGQKVMVMNLHLEAFDAETRVEQIKTLKEIYAQYASKQPVILMGDFNSVVPAAGSEEDAIEQLMKSPWIRSAIPFDEHDKHSTFPSEAPVKMIDYIFYNENFLTCAHYEVIVEAGQISDHLPVAATLQLKANTY